jgi:4a-hydroxytetrahydrobiopterin dehydratase
MSPLSPEEARTRLGNLPGWQIESGELVRKFEFKDFLAALHFVNQLADAAEKAGHHPDIDIRYNRVRLALVTHDAGGLTAKDFDLAARASSLAG